jgi:Iap family predicted aminopeptidase
MKQEVIENAETLCELSPRMWENETEAAEKIRQFLEEKGLEYRRQRYSVVYPTFPEYWLEADGERMQCIPSGLRSGKIGDKKVIDNWNVSSFGEANINFNPYCEGLSKPTFYDAPALTVAREDLQKIFEAEEVEGKLVVEEKEFKSENIIVGNLEDPEYIFLTHYDSWWGGFLDNAFAVAALVELAEKTDLEKACIAFTGSEEFSDEEKYWCYGYRRFEERYSDVMEEVELAVVDALGLGEPMATDKFMEEAFLLEDEGLMEKADLLTTHPKNWRSIYHSPLDTREKAEDIDEALKLLQSYFDERGLIK